MIRNNLNNIPEHDLPPSYSYRKYKEKKDKKHWAEIESSANEFENKEKALNHFNKEFGNREKQLKSRCIFLQKNKKIIGTATAWYGKLEGEKMGRLHWVAIKPQNQGKGLGKPLVAKAMSILKKHHEKAYLTTQTTSPIAIKIYLDFGFEPHIQNQKQRKGWRIIKEKIEEYKK